MHEVSHRSCEVGRHRKFSNKVWCIGPSRNSVILLVKPSLFVDVLALPSTSWELKLHISSSSSSSSSPNSICPLIPLKTKRITCERKETRKEAKFFFSLNLILNCSQIILTLPSAKIVSTYSSKYLMLIGVASAKRWLWQPLPSPSYSTGVEASPLNFTIPI